MKKIYLNKSVYELTEEFPELIDILKEMGFLGVSNPVVRNTLGRKMTIPEGSKKQGKSLEEVLQALRGKGFEAINP
ncbi:MAG: DUF1858 domain-containing protein [Actinomycetota bacterium]|nr:DUF1858 domain-containing protein [Actinomycetota bacterium]